MHINRRLNGPFMLRRPTSLPATTVNIDSYSPPISTSVIKFTAKKARVYLAICALVNGSNYVFTKMLQDAVPSALLTLLRFSLATLFFLPTLFTFKADAAVVKGAVQIGLTQAVGFISQIVALRHASASKVAFFSCLSVALCPLLDLFSSTINGSTSDRKPTYNDFIAPFLALLGVFVLEFGGIEEVRWTDILILASPLSFASGFRKSEKLAKKYPDVLMFNTGIQMLTVTAVALIWTILSGQFPVTKVAYGVLKSTFTNWKVMIGLLYAGIVTTAWTQLTEQKGIKQCLFNYLNI
jgi:hypothetical protein